MRYFVLATYDISDSKRLRRMFQLLRGYGDHVQYSIFLCQLTPKDEVVLSEKIKDIVHHREDQVILIKLGKVDGKGTCLPDQWQVIGNKLSIADNSVMIF